MIFSIFEFVSKTFMYKSLEIDKEKLTLMGIKFPDLLSLERTANAIGTNMFEGFQPTKELIQLYLEWKNAEIKESELVARLYAIYGKQL